MPVVGDSRKPNSIKTAVKTIQALKDPLVELEDSTRGTVEVFVENLPNVWIFVRESNERERVVVVISSHPDGWAAHTPDLRRRGPISNSPLDAWVAAADEELLEVSLKS